MEKKNSLRTLKFSNMRTTSLAFTCCASASAVPLVALTYSLFAPCSIGHRQVYVTR